MSGAAPQMASIVTLTVSIAIALSLFGLREGLLRLRPEPRRCPTCGQRLRSWTCWSCTGSRGT